VPALGLKKFTITEGRKVVWKGGSYVKGTKGITAAMRDGDWVTFDVGSGSYRFELTGK
jgi:hypothetical protein